MTITSSKRYVMTYRFHIDGNNKLPTKQETL